MMHCIVDYIPFIYHADDDVAGKYKVDFKSLLQAAIIAIATGGIVMYGTQRTLALQLETIEEDVREIKHNQQEFRDDFYSPHWIRPPSK